MSEMISQHTDLSPEQVEWLHLLIGDWQVISDLSFADLVLWLPTRERGFVAIAHCRPSTGATVYYEDIVGLYASGARWTQLEAALTTGRWQRPKEPHWFGAHAVREETIPVLCGGQIVAVLARQTNLGSGRAPSRQETNYVESADDLLAMVARGEFPFADTPAGTQRGAPRVGDGLIRLNAEGEVLYASPNALSCFHRLGIIGALVGRVLVEVLSGVVEYAGTVDEAMPVVAMGRVPWWTDIETKSVGISLRSLPLTVDGQRVGAIMLCRDVSEVRRRERELMTKDATIREIHHRVKNNLATVAALLRLQARRSDSPEAKAALEEATRRVATISMVHESLSQTLDEHVDLDGMLQRALRLTAEVAATGTKVRTELVGSFGLVPARDAAPLALVLTELVTNAVEHGFSDNRPTGTVTIAAERAGASLRVSVTDDGLGLDAADRVDSKHKSSSGLGIQIVRTLVENELGGIIKWRTARTGGTEVLLRMQVRE